MGLVRNTNMSVLLVLLCCFCLEFGLAKDTITATNFIKDSETIVSKGSDFILGFFSPPNSTYRYVGIWYDHISVSTVIWVANRNKPLKSSSGILTISEDGNLVVLDEQKGILWSSNVTNSVIHSCPKMKISTNVRTGKKVQLTSWKSPSDPSIGSFSAGIHPVIPPGNIHLERWAFGSCNPQNSPICSCFRGFEPKNKEEWNRGNWTSGCVRRTPLQCERVNNGSEEGKKDGFLKFNMMKVPDFADWSSANEDECRHQCLENCSCLAYAYETGIGCMSWARNLIDTQKFSKAGVDLYVRVASSELDKVGDAKKIITITVIIGTIFISICTFLLWRKKKATGISLFNRKGKHIKKFPRDNLLEDNLNQVKVQELPLFNFEKLATATDNFHLSNKLGQGGFGPVYRVMVALLEDPWLAVLREKRKMLIYEYMPNKSLDAFLFDFGMARIFGSNEDQANTNRVVGTYGYMSPEYAMEGQFSEKSDVFSFGVLLLEILSGRRNSRFYDDEKSPSLLGLAWKLWNADNIVELIDPMISESGFEMEILRCIHVGLLCVQEFVTDRPTVPIVISMLKSEIIDLPPPKQPAFIERQIALKAEYSQRSQSICSINNVTITMVQGR
uniref:Receptor-like serine/threonine-protein kinase n=1 Tax=Fagus sylvatica TaxID=28930 RepID=A0A2N9ICZ8_FAGSY